MFSSDIGLEKVSQYLLPVRRCVTVSALFDIYNHLSATHKRSIMTTDNDDANEPRRIKSVLRANDIIETIQARNGATLQELQEHLGLTKATVYTYLTTLCECGFVTKDDGEYRLGLRFITIGEYVRNEMDLYTAGQDQVDQLAE